MYLSTLLVGDSIAFLLHIVLSLFSVVIILRKDWAEHFPNSNLIAYSANPLLIFPTHYVGDKGHFSDTEPSMGWVQWKRKQYELQDQQEKTRKAAVDQVTDHEEL